ncbi:hypothetical protein [Jannaschia ovalis]|uniref:DUF2726 domain-containing protein n=1 Tax=Jannaschia ovalis TaxID=3038773 RepID=A0ABY8L933_9RHOB|nr:hypothetical protein [Jannaschia sp. GRR-S6-38]WGH77794.1 hypothetical protein P8627_12220 [Jannaschia sp. GRR-S6-38]
MQLDRLMAKTMTRLVKTGLSVKRRPAEPAPAGAEAPALRGSGSWANDWPGARSAVERAKSLARPGRSRKSAKSTAPDTIPEGTIRQHPLMSTRDVKLHNWIADRLEAEAPWCTLHAGVALKGFLTSDLTRPGYDPLAGMVADLAIVDSHGHVASVLLRENTADPAHHLLLLDALMDADIPIVDIQPRPSLSALWAEISATLPEA